MSDSETYPGNAGATYVTTTAVSGRFVTSRTATGSMTFTQTYVPPKGRAEAAGPRSYR